MKPIVALLTTFTLASACEVPVFRFALERWPADPLPVEVIADSSTGPEGTAAMKWLENKVPDEAPSNLTVKFLDPEGPSDRRGLLRLLRAGQPPGAPPAPPLWQGPLSEINARRLSGSPARVDIARQLLEGTSAVWVVISRGDTEADEKAVQAVTRGMNRAMQELNLPSGVIHPEEAAQKLAENPKATMDDVLRTKVPLKISFTVKLIRVEDHEEEILRQIVEKLAPPQGDPGEPLVAPIFGRGRILSPAPASMIDENRVYGACAYLCGACACMVKQQNPGIDLPFRIDWDANIQQHLASIDRSLDMPRTETVQYGPVSKPDNATAVVATTATSSPAMRWFWIGGVTALVLLVAGIWKRPRA